MFPFIVFTLIFGGAFGATLDQTQPKVHDAVAKYIVGADHDPVVVNDGVTKQ